MTAPRIREATGDDVAAVARLIGTAFTELAVSHWLVPADPVARQRILTDDFAIVVAHAIEHGEIDFVPDVAVAVWFHLIDGPPPEPADYDRRLTAACGPATDRFRQLDDVFAELHPTSYPHHHLAFLATRRGHRDQGWGSRLLDRHHAGLDVPAYLEATSEDAARLYRRHGYEPLGARYLPDDGPPIHPMWRPPSVPLPGRSRSGG